MNAGQHPQMGQVFLEQYGWPYGYGGYGYPYSYYPYYYPMYGTGYPWYYSGYRSRRHYPYSWWW